jgi:hypothetical protein
VKPITRRFRTGLFAAMLAGVAFTPITFADAPETPAAEKDAEPKLPEFKVVTKGMTASAKGLLTVYTHPDNDPMKDPSKILAVIPQSLMGKDLLLATSISRGDMLGFPVGSDLVRFQQAGNRVMIAVPDVRMKQQADKPVNSAVENTYTPTFLAALPIVSKTEAGDLVVDMEPFFAGASQYASPFAMVGMRMVGAPAMVRYTKVKSFEDNTLVDVDVAFASTGGAGNSVGVGYSFRRLPDVQANDFKPRNADERVGYFTTVRQDWNLPYNSRETVVRYINRWDIQKKDPSLDVSPPAKPITFIIEKSVPLQWRRFVREGIEEWNKAYEAVGITNAIVVQQQTDDNEFADIDPEDARYNFFRWIVTGEGFAMGPSRPDPRTGEILDADIIFDDSMVRYQFEDWRNLLGPESLASVYGPDVIEFLEKNPDFVPMGMEHADVVREANKMRARTHLMSGETRELLVDQHTLASRPMNTRPTFHPNACTYARGMQAKMMSLHALASAGAGNKVPERLIGEMIRDVTAHEVGHTLGLRHNFKGSTWLSPDEIKKRRDSGNEALFATTMDYNDILVFPGDKLENIKHITSPVIGPYDMWAIEYGYTAVEGDEKEALNKIAGRTNEPGLAFATDEDVMGFSSPDPGSNRWDMSSDPIAWAENRSKLADELLATFQTWAVKPDEPTHFLRSSFMNLMYDRVRPMSYVARIVGGQTFNRNRTGDANARTPLELVSPADQRKALDMLAKTIFSDDFVKVDADLLNKLVVARNWDDSFGSPNPRIDFPVHQVMLSLQSGTLMQLTNPLTLQRVYDAELKSKAEDAFSVGELISRTQSIIWGDTSKLSAADTKIVSTRRNLQTQWLNNMIAVARMQAGSMVSPDVINMARHTLRQLHKDIGDNKSSDLGTRAHLGEARSRIERVLDAPEVDVRMNGPQVIIIGDEAGR